MRVLHTADWHLGHSLGGLSRAHEHAVFLDWLSDRVEELAADALVIAGDVFDHQNPSAEAQQAFYRFLAGLSRRCRGLTIVVVAGNHDGAGRLNAPSALLRALDIHMVGHLARDGDGRLDTDSLLVPLRNRDGEVAALCCAVPFLRPVDLHDLTRPRTREGEDPMLAGLSSIYTQLAEEARRAMARQAGQEVPLLGTGHFYAAGCLPSADSERRIFIGGQEQVPVDSFRHGFDYVALGHLHRAQRVGGQDHVRYSGSPIPLSVDEAGYTHQLLCLDFAPGRPPAITPVPIPRAVPMIRLPADGGAEPLDTVLDRLRALPPHDGPEETRPFLALKVRLTKPEPLLRHHVDKALEGRNHRLVSIRTDYARPDPGGAAAGAEAAGSSDDLKQIDPETVFLRLYASRFPDPPGPDLLAAFRSLHAQARMQEGGEAADRAAAASLVEA